MTYTPHLISNWATGLTDRMQPWLSADDAQQELFDGFIYRGVQSKREGYQYYATGQKAGLPYRESRIVHTLAAVPAAQVPNGIIVTFTLAGTGPIARGSVTVNGSNPVVVGTDNGLGLIGAWVGAGIASGTINYTTGALSVTFTVAPAVASTVTFTYSFMPGNPVMMVANFIRTATNTKELIVADTRYVNRFNTTFNILEDISPAGVFTGTAFDFFTWTNYASATNTPRLLFSNNVDVIQRYDGTNVAPYVYNMETTDAVPVAVTVLTCSWMGEFKDRLILLRTTENGVVYPQRIRISGTGANSDDFRLSASGAGVIDIPDGTWIQGAAFNRDDLIIFTEAATWIMRYTGTDVKPFVLDKLDDSRGCNAPFSPITYLNRTTAASPRGLIISDGYKVERQDDEIPDFSFDEIDTENFRLCFAGSVDDDQDHYLIYPKQQGLPMSERILVTNYGEDTYAIYRLPMSCMGTYIRVFDTTWNDLIIYANWDEFAAAYSDWQHFPFSRQAPVSIGGGHRGEIWELNATEGIDNPVKVRNIVATGQFELTITTDWNNFSLNAEDLQKGADTIFLTGVLGMLEVNNQQFNITAVTNNNTFVVATTSPTGNFGAYTSAGTASRVIPFESLTKKFNPFIDSDKKVRCGWLYMYVDSAETLLERQIAILGATQANPCVISTFAPHDLHTGDQVRIFGVTGMTQLNGLPYFVTVLSPISFSLNGIDSTAFGAYVGGGFAATTLPAKIDIEIIVNDNQAPTQVANPAFPPNTPPYQGNCTNLILERGSKKWYKVFINQTGRFIQFRLKNRQAGATINIQAMMPGFQPVGRLL